LRLDKTQAAAAGIKIPKGKDKWVSVMKQPDKVGQENAAK